MKGERENRNNETEKREPKKWKGNRGGGRERTSRKLKGSKGGAKEGGGYWCRTTSWD